ncbi:MAG: polynucleotide kinase-phosphatase [Saprospiraceae bacterium]|nr:polynucleotide kinase-phosphatase [Saprospiraceae bacterium]
MTIQIPEMSLVAMVGITSSGKSTLARQLFKPTEIISSDYCRAIVSDDENDQSASKDAFDLLHYIARKRLQRGKLTVVDATNIQKSARKTLIDIAKEQHVLPIAIVLNIPRKKCENRHQERTDRNFGLHVLRHQYRALKRSISQLKREGFRYVYVVDSEEEAQLLQIERTKLYNDRKEWTGPFDIIGDVHGCFEELKILLEKLGYHIKQTDQYFGYEVTPPTGRTAIFVGDLVDRGPASDKVLRLVMSMTVNGSGISVCGNHDAKLLKKLQGKNVNLKHGLAETWQQLEKETPAFKEELKQFLSGLISHYVLDRGRLVVAHAGLREEMQGRASGAVRSFCMYGETTGEVDEFGLPVRYDWAREYRGKALMVYGHTPVVQAEFYNNTIDVDTGCVFGGSLTAMRYPERSLVRVPAKATYAEPGRPIEESTRTDEADEGLLHLEDILGRRTLFTRFGKNVVIQEENSIAALEVMSRFAINPKWLIYLPPTMSPTEVSEENEYLEYPKEAFDYYESMGQTHVVCQEKHMGSRVMVIVGKSQEAVEQRFDVKEGGIGVVYTRSGRAFFDDKSMEQALLKEVQKALTATGFWESFETDWVLLDCELMPWSAKAQSLLREQYAAVGSAATLALSEVEAVLAQARERGIQAEKDLQISQRKQLVKQYQNIYGAYCWPVEKLEDYKLAPFHILATEGKVHTDQSHEWHMEHLHAICRACPPNGMKASHILKATDYRVVDVTDEKSRAEATKWWLELTQANGEGMVVKPQQFLAKNEDYLVQPAIKVRGREYLRIIYGPEYTLAENMQRLRKRKTSKKRRMALSEFVLGLEALERFAQKEAFRRVHECVFGILAMGSEPVDPAL